MKKVRKWTYLLMFLGTGVIYLSCVDRWEVYAKPLTQAKNWYHSLNVEEKLLSYADNVQATGQPSFITNKQEGLDVSGALSGNGNGPDAAGGQDAENSGGQQTIIGNGGGQSAAAGNDKEQPPAIGTGEEEPGGETGEGASAGTEHDDETLPPDRIDSPDTGEGDNDDFEEEEPEDTKPHYMAVEDDYFADAAFIGDSRTVGLFEYGGLEETAAFYCSRGLTVFEMFDAKLASVPDSKKKISVEEALQQNTFSKIYLMIGINEMGGNLPPFLEEYKNAVEKLRELQPDAIIYLQAIIKVTEKRSSQGDYINNEGIDLRNEAISELADNEKVFYLDVNPLLCDETGGMISDYTTDGVHLKAKYIEIWKDFLKSHAICLDE